MLIAFLFAAALVAFAISTVAGGGAGLILMPILALLVPTAEVPAALSLGTAASSVSRTFVFWRSVRWDIVRLFVPIALPFAALGVWLLSWFDPVYVKLILGIFLVANLLLLFIPKFLSARPRSRRVSARSVRLIGAAAGLLSGFTGQVGLLFNRFYLRMGMEKSEIVATRALNELLLHVLKIVLYAGLGLLTARSLMAGAVVAIAALAASFLMKWGMPYIREHHFHLAGNVAMAVAGVSMMASAAPVVLLKNHAGVRYHTSPAEAEVHAFWGSRHYSLIWNDRRGIGVEKGLSLTKIARRYGNVIPAAAYGTFIVAASKVEWIDGEQLELHYAARNRRWKTVLDLED